MPSQDQIALIKTALAPFLGIPIDDPVLHALAVAYHDVAHTAYRVISAGHGSVKIYFSDHWIESSAFEVSSLPDPIHRRPPRPE